MKEKFDDSLYIAIFTLILTAATLWIFSSYLHFIIVAAVLALSTSQVFASLCRVLQERGESSWPGKNSELISAFLLTGFFILMICGPLIYFLSVTYEQVNNLDPAQIKQTVLEIVDKTKSFLNRIPWLQVPLSRLENEGVSFIRGPAVEVAFDWLKGLASGTGSLLVNFIWILIFYFLFNFHGKAILGFLSSLLPVSEEHQEYLYRECAGTVSVVFYGTLFNMVAQGVAFGLLMVFIGGYNAGYLGVLAGFCSVIPIIGAALVYVPVVALEMLAGHFISAVFILAFAWVVMGFFIDNILRLFFIGTLKKMFGFEYTMNEILILLAILAGISTIGFWGLIIGPSVLALTLATAHLYSTRLQQQK